MSENVFAPFSTATCEVFKLLLDLDASMGAPETLSSIADTEDKINIVIGVTGDLSGEILYRFPRETTLEIVRIMSGMEFDEVDEFVTSAIGEIANIISGNALTGLSEQNVTCDILPPRILSAAGEALSDSAPILHTEVETSIGNVELNIQMAP